MARIKAKPVRDAPPRFQKEEILPEESKNFLLGLVTDVDPAKIPNEALTSVFNMCYRRGMLLRRNGLTLHSTKPDSSKILNLYGVEDPTSGAALLRFTSNKIYRYTNTGWTDVTPSAIAANSGGVYDYFSFTVGDSRPFFANGVDPIREIDLTLDVYKALGNAPSYKYITTAFNRLIGANADEVGWSGDLNYEEWDPLVDLSAGSTPIVESPSDVNDDITGLFSQSNNLIVPRQRSLWIGSAQASATNPFKFRSAITGIGADCPRAIKLTRHGLIWFNLQNLAVYVWNFSQFDPDGSDIAAPIRTNLRNAIASNIEDIWATFSWSRNEFSLHSYSDVTSKTTVWTYSFTYKNWTKSEFNSICESQDLAIDGSSVEIDMLTGTIDDLSGTIEALAGISSGANRLMADINGELYIQKEYEGLTNQSADITLTDNGTSFTSEVESKIYESVTNDTFINAHSITLIPYSVGSVSFSYSKDDGQTFSTPKVITFVTADLNKGHKIVKRKAIKADRFLWKIESSDCMFALTSASVKSIQINERR